MHLTFHDSLHVWLDAEDIISKYSECTPEGEKDYLEKCVVKNTHFLVDKALRLKTENRVWLCQKVITAV